MTRTTNPQGHGDRSSRGRAVMATKLALFLLLTRSFSLTCASQKYTDCDVDSYYSNLLSSTTTPPPRPSLHALIRSTHRSVVPYTSNSRLDVWDALIALDYDPTDNTTVQLVYSSKSAPAIPHGTPSTWNREHLWPKSRGVSTSGHDFTDLHHLRPEDASVNTARSNRHYATCGLVHPFSQCVYPGHPEAAADTERDESSWLPPTQVRGDVARAILYMALRYDALDPYTTDLILSDCPSENQTNVLGYLSQIIHWHLLDPVSDEERLRNDAVCKDWQGNRNPFVDHPEWVLDYYGANYPQVPPNPVVGGGYCSCTDSCATTVTAAPVAPIAPSPTETPSISPNASPSTPGTCMGMKSGDIVAIGYNSDGTSSSGDVVILLALTDLPPSAAFYLTDNAWTGTHFRDNEGVVKLVVPSEGIGAGTIIGYGNGVVYGTGYNDGWIKVDGTVALSTAGDNVLVYCMNSDDVGDVTNLGGLTYAIGGWMEPTSEETVFGTKGSALPNGREATAHVALPHLDNAHYNGTRNGTKEELLCGIVNETNWIGSNSKLIDPAAALVPFYVTSSTPTPPMTMIPGTCMGIEVGDVMPVGYNSDGTNDVVALLATRDLPPNATIYITDNAWTGTKFRTNEGVQKLVIPSSGIATGIVFGFGIGSYEDLWEKGGGTMALSASGENFFVYCLEKLNSVDDGTIRHLSALTYASSGWIDPNSIADDSDYGTLGSALPTSLEVGNAVVTLAAHVDNAWYDGPRDGGTRQEVLSWITSDGGGNGYWSGSNSDLLNPDEVFVPFDILPIN